MHKTVKRLLKNTLLQYKPNKSLKIKKSTRYIVNLEV